MSGKPETKIDDMNKPLTSVVKDINDMTKPLPSVKDMNIFEKMLHIQTEIPTVAKNLNVETGKNSKSYKAVSERDVKDAVKPLEAKYRVYSYPVTKELIDTDTIAQKSQSGERKVFFIREKVTYRFVNIDKPDEYIEIDGYGDGIDTGDKTPGKADSYASKYCIMSAYKISTGDDPDKEISQEYTKAEKKPAEVNNKQPMSAEEFSTKFQWFKTELSKNGVDIHDDKVAEYIRNTAKVSSIDPAKLLMDIPSGEKVLAVMEGVLDAKKKKV